MSENKELEQKREQYQKILVKNLILTQKLRNQELLIASLSHDLRGAVFAIVGYVKQLTRTELNDAQKKYIERLSEGSDFLEGLLGELLDVVKLQEGNLKLYLEPTRIDKLLEQSLSMVESRITENVTLKVDLIPVEFELLLDKRRIQQVFLNLLSNATKFTEYGTILLTLTSLREKENRIEVIVDVLDTGKGISKALKETLFLPYVSNDMDEGSGLGLYISKALVELMDGEIHVYSEEGKGTLFRVEFFCDKVS